MNKKVALLSTTNNDQAVVWNLEFLSLIPKISLIVA